MQQGWFDRRFLYDPIRLQNPDSLSNARTLVQVNQVIYDGGSIRAGMNMAQAGKQAQEAQKRSCEDSLAAEVSETYLHVLALWFVVFGSPMGLCFPPAQTIAFSDLPEQKVNMGSGITNVVRLVTGSIATSVCVTVLQRTMDSAYVGLSAAANASHQPLVAATRKLEMYLGRHGTPAGLVRPRVNMVLQAAEKALAGEIAFQQAFWWLV